MLHSLFIANTPMKSAKHITNIWIRNTGVHSGTDIIAPTGGLNVQSAERIKIRAKEKKSSCICTIYPMSGLGQSFSQISFACVPYVMPDAIIALNVPNRGPRIA